MTGHYDRGEAAFWLTEASQARIAADPFSTIPAEADPAPCLRRNAHTPHDTARGRCPGTAPEFPAEAIEQVASAPAAVDFINPGPLAEIPAAAAVDLWRAEWPYPVLSPAEFAALYGRAAQVITARGYYPYELQGYADEPGISIVGALSVAALERARAEAEAEAENLRQLKGTLTSDPGAQLSDNAGKALDTAAQRSAADLTEELETRLSAVIYVYGLLHSRTGIRDLSDQLAAWELGHYGVDSMPGQAEAVALLEGAARMFAALEPVTEAPAV